MRASTEAGRPGKASFARYGLVASSKDKWLPSFGVDNTFQTTKQLRVGPWYNASPTDSQSCCQLETVATEFAGKNRPPLRDPLTVRKNVYRVLLTRGRDGTVVFIPPDERLDATCTRLLDCGMRDL